ACAARRPRPGAPPDRPDPGGAYARPPPTPPDRSFLPAQPAANRQPRTPIRHGARPGADCATASEQYPGPAPCHHLRNKLRDTPIAARHVGPAPPCSHRAATVIQINPQQTSLDEVADVNLRCPGAHVLPELVEATWAKPAKLDRPDALAPRKR